jgi:RHS repeat-associated protein
VADAAGVAYVVADHLGTPRELISAQGEMVWAASWRLWGAARRVWRKSARAAGDRAGRNWRDDAWRDDEEGGAQAFYAKAEPALEPMPFRFPGQFEDAETGLYYNRHRHYDPLAGGYVSPDPIGLAGGDRPNGYVERPGCWRDPLGLEPIFIDPNSINFSQITVSPNNYEDLMRNAQWDWPRSPLTAIERGGKIVSFDNRRLMAARQAGLKTVPVILVKETDLRPETGRAWGDEFDKRLKRNTLPPTGTGDNPAIVKDALRNLSAFKAGKKG